MTRYQAKAGGQRGTVFAHLPVLPARTAAGALAGDGVSGSMCHQIQPYKLGREESFTAGFFVDEKSPAGKCSIYGPYDIDAGRKRVMQSARQFQPQQGMQVKDSALCGSCHTLYTHTRGPDGEVIGTLPEQAPYLEWKHSDYYQVQSCQSCHMPQLKDNMTITSVLSQQREDFSCHVFRGGNFFMPRIFHQNRAELGVTALPREFVQAARETANNLTGDSAELKISGVSIRSGRLEIDVSITNLAGHKLPTAYPSRRAWLQVTIKDRNEQTIFETGALRPDGSIAGNANDLDPTRFEPHHQVIDEANQVQIYKAIMVAPDDQVTTGLLRAIRFMKDNRILPQGFDKTSANDDSAVKSKAEADTDFIGGSDKVRYSVPVDTSSRAFSIQASYGISR